MNLEQERLAYDEIEISAAAIVRNCIKLSKWVLLLAVVLAIMVPCAKYKQDVEVYNLAVQMAQEVYVTEEEYQDVQKYLCLQNNVRYMQDYLSNASVMKLNPNNVYFGEVQYYIDGKLGEKEAITVSLCNYIQGQAFLEEFSEKLQDINTTYVAEQISVIASNAQGGLITIQILAKDEIECDTYVKTVKELVLAKAEELKTEVGDYEFSIIEENVHSGYSSEVYAIQKRAIEDLEEYRKLLSEHTSTLSYAEIKAIVKEDESYAFLINIVEPKFDFRYIAIGILVGILIGTVTIMVYTIYSGKLQTDRELSKRLTLSYVGTLAKKKNSSEELEILAIKIERILRLKDVKCVNILSTKDITNLDELRKLILLLGERGVKCDYIGNPLKDKIVMEELSIDVPVIVAEVVGESKVKDIYKEVSHCNDIKIDVLGYITIYK